MTDDLISREAAIDALGERPMVWTSDDEYSLGARNQYDMDKLAIETIPAAELERKKGKWIAVDSYSAFGGDEATWEAHGNPVAYYYCSVCKKQNYVDEFGDPILSKYCPECGARLGGIE